MDLERDPISTRLPRRMGGGWDVLLAGTRIGMIYESKEIIAKNARTPSIAIDPLGRHIHKGTVHECQVALEEHATS